MRAINFSAGPAGLPLEALQQAQDELLDFQGSGMSIMEQSHRGKVYEAVHQEALDLLRQLLAVPASHEILFLQGGASLQFAQVPMNFLNPGQTADYVLTGGWSEKALEEAQRVGKAEAVYSSRLDDGRYVRVPRPEEVPVRDAAAYVHSTSNNTLFGTQYHRFLETGKVPHVCDMSSDFLCRPLDVSKFSLIYAGAQKNLGPSGVVVAILRKDWMASARKDIPKILRYQTQADNQSMYNTPPTFAIYLCRNVLQWIQRQGGLPAMEVRNRKKAEVLYGALDAMKGFYQAPVEKESRSWMNIVFRLKTEELEERFVKEAQKASMVGLKGHRSTGGIRASTYNAVSVADVETLVSFMTEFSRKNG